MKDRNRNAVIEECAMVVDGNVMLYEAYAGEQGHTQEFKDRMLQHALTCRDIAIKLRRMKRGS